MSIIEWLVNRLIKLLWYSGDLLYDFNEVKSKNP